MGFPGEKPCSCYLLLISWHFTPPPLNSEQIQVALGITLGTGVERETEREYGSQSVCF